LSTSHNYCPLFRPAVIIIIIISFTQQWLDFTWDVLRPRFHVRFSILVRVGRFPPIRVLPLIWG